MKFFIMCLTIFCAVNGPTIPKDYPPEQPKGCNGPTETVRR
jgi:hypothetical protein